MTLHRLSDKDFETKTATCSVCGPTTISVGGSLANAQCMTKRREYAITYQSARHGMTVDQLQDMLDEQGGGCALCGKTTGRMSVDHDHDCCPGTHGCGKCVRAILCGNCNMGLGQFRDNAELMRKAADYIEIWKNKSHPDVKMLERMIS